MGYLLKQASTTRVEVQTATPLKTTSSYNMTLPGKISYLLGGDTRRQIGADIGGTTGLVTGGVAGALMARKKLMAVSDAIGDMSEAEVRKAIRRMPGKWGLTKALGTLLKKTSLLNLLPRKIKTQGALGAGLLIGTPILGNIAGGLAGHYITDPE